MECACSVPTSCDDYDGGSTGERVRRARKEHKCYECQGAIKPFEEYHFFTCFYEGTIKNFKLCKSCKIVVDTFFDNGWIFGQIWDDLKEYLWGWGDDLPSNCISKLPPNLRDIICDILQERQEK